MRGGKGENPRTAIPELEAGLLVMLLGSLESLRLSRRIDTGIGAEEINRFSCLDSRSNPWTRPARGLGLPLI
jgi:hypothetical protein